MFPPPVVGGLEKQALLLNSELSLIGLKCIVLSYSYGCSFFYKGIRKDLSVSGIYATRKFNKFFLLVRLFYYLVKYRKKIIAIHCHTFSIISLLSGLIAKLFCISWVLKIPNVGALGLGLLKANRFYWALKPIFKSADVFVCLNRQSVFELEEFGIPRNKLALLSNCVEINNDLNRSYAKEDTVDDKSKIVFGFLGRLAEEKQPFEIIKAFIELTSNYQHLNNIELRIGGDGPLYSSLINYVASESLPRNLQINILGYVSDTFEFFSEIDCLVLFSKSEGMSNSMLEAARTGTPIIASRESYASDFLGRVWSTQFIVDGHDVTNLSSALVKFCNMSLNDRRIFGESLLNKVSLFCNPKIIGHDYLKLYKKLNNELDICEDFFLISELFIER